MQLSGTMLDSLSDSNTVLLDTEEYSPMTCSVPEVCIPVL